MNNLMFARLVEFALQVAERYSTTEEERRFVATYANGYQAVFCWPGCGYDIDETFPTIEERRFWSGIYYDVAHLIFLRELGCHDVTYWQAQTIGSAITLAELLRYSANIEGEHWYPETMAGKEAIGDWEARSNQSEG